jgi:hypothetical protein
MLRLGGNVAIGPQLNARVVGQTEDVEFDRNRAQ